MPSTLWNLSKNPASSFFDLRFTRILFGQEFLKWLAIVSMTVDHVSEHLLSGYQPGRAFGRLAFPLFAMFVAYNYTRFYQGRFPDRYLSRLLLFGLLAQAAYITFGLERINIMATLSLGLLTLYFHANGKYVWLVILSVGIALFNHFVYSIEYGLPGVLLVLFLTFQKRLLILLPALFIIATPATGLQNLPVIPLILPTAFYSKAHTLLFETAFALAIVLAATAYTRMCPSAGRSKHKYFFYAFYPAHLSIILAMEWYLS